MPTYEFKCENCGRTFDIHASIQEKEEGLYPNCPFCGDKGTHQVLSGGLFVRYGEGTSFNPPNCGPDSGPGCCG